MDYGLWIMDYWIIGLLDYWIIGLLDYWIIGLLDHWSLEFGGYGVWSVECGVVVYGVWSVECGVWSVWL